MPESLRLDAALVARGLCSGRDRAAEAVRAGRVRVDGKLVTKPAAQVSPDSGITLADAAADFVSRGGQKLARALAEFGIRLTDLRALDAGASTGGFTDCMLRAGAAAVCAVDVGENQLDPRLRADPRVVCLDRTNIRHVTAEKLPWRPDFIAADLSFISLTTVLPVFAALLPEHGALVTLIKPQFEVGRARVGKNGVVRDPDAQEDALRRVCAAAAALGLAPRGLIPSPVRGPAGNLEFLAHFIRGGEPRPADFAACVRRAQTEARP